MLRELRLPGTPLRVVHGVAQAAGSLDIGALLRQWDPMVQTFSRSYANNSHAVEDIAQELRLTLVHVAGNVHPTRRPGEFVKVLRTSMRNRAVDLLRSTKAQKRMAVTGKVLHCLLCDVESTWLRGMEPVCSLCGRRGVVGQDTEELVWKVTRVNDASLDASSQALADTGDGEGEPGTVSAVMQDSSSEDPVTCLEGQEAIEKVRKLLIPFPDRALFNLRVDPPEDFAQFVMDHGRTIRVNLYKVPYWLTAKYMGLTNDKLVRLAHARICAAVAQTVGRPELAPAQVCPV